MSIKLICEYCKKEFVVPFKQRNKKYCNRQCYINSGIKGKPKQTILYETRKCLNCGKEFEIRKKLPNKLCSDECRKIWNSLPENKEKRINQSKISLLEKYGVDSLFKTIDGQKNARNSFKIKYGVDHPMFVKEFVDKLKSTSKSNYTPILLNKLKTYNIKLIDDYEQNKNGNTSKPYKFQCLICNNIFTSTLLGSGKRPICRKCNPLQTNNNLNVFFEEFLNENNINFDKNNRIILKPKEIDYLINNIGFELNGNYYHSEYYGGKNKTYHVNKTKICNDNNIKLIHIFEDEILLKKEIVKSRLKNILNLTSNKIYARKCIVKEISKKDSTKFLNENHLQGNSVDKIRYGLYSNNELVSIMTFGNLRKSLGNKNKNDHEYELLRFCNKINTNVIGGFSKILKYFIKAHIPNKIITYADIRWSGINPNSTVYEKNGFKFIHITPPNYWYIKTDNFLNRFNRFQFRKDVLVKEGFNKNKTEWEIMQERGFDRIWDCGSMKFEINFPIGPIEDLLTRDI